MSQEVQCGPEPKVLVGIPAFNEEERIAPVIVGALGKNRSVLVVDDGSDDATSIVAKRMGAKVLRHERNLGKGRALKDIFEFARREQVDILVTLDADGQHDPDDIERLVGRCILFGDVIVGARNVKTAQRMGRLRRLGQVFLDWISGGAKIDFQSGFRAYSFHALEVLNPKEDGMGVDVDILRQANEKGLRIDAVPIEISYRHGRGDHKTNPLLHFTDVLCSVVFMRLTKRPLRFIGMPGLALCFFGLLGWVSVVNSYLANRQLAVGQALVFGIMLLIGFLLVSEALTIFALRIQAREFSSAR